MSVQNREHFVVSIPKEELALLPPEEYKGGIILIDTIEEADKAVEQLFNESLIGFDTETKPSFKKGLSHKVSLLQLSTHSVCYLFRLNHIGLPESVKKLLENEKITKIGLSIRDDFNNLNKLTEINPEGFIDLQSFVKPYKIFDNSLTRINAIIFGKRISKGQRLTNWEADTLTDAQQAYAALDALACIRIYEYLLSGKFIPEESEYFREPPLPPINPNQLAKLESDGNKDELNVNPQIKKKIKLSKTSSKATKATNKT